MAHLIEQPSLIVSEGNKPKKIEEYIGRVNSKSREVSIAKMSAPAGWVEPGQTPEFDEYTVVLSGRLLAETKSETIEVAGGQAIRLEAGEWIRYSTPPESGAEYVSVCLPAFSPETVHRDD